MKKIVLAIIAMVCFASISQAQLKPEAGSMGFGFNLTGLANVSFGPFMQTGVSGSALTDPTGLGVLPAGINIVDDLVPQQMFFGRYYIASDLALRVGLGINSTSMKWEATDSAGTAITTQDGSTKAFSFGLGVGVEKHFASAATKVDPYMGAQINFSSLGKIKSDYNSSTNSDPAISTAMVGEMAGGSAFGVDLIGGFNYFFTDNFAIGAEFSWGFMSASVGGDWSTSSTSTAGGTSTTVNTVGMAKQGWSGFRVGHTSGVTASIFW